MMLKHKLLLGASAIAVLVAATGGIGWYAKNRTLYLSNIRLAGQELLTLTIKECANLRQYTLSTDPAEMDRLEQEHQAIHAEMEMWSAALKYGTESKAFTSNQQVYSLWVRRMNQSNELNMTIPYIPQISNFATNFNVARLEFEAIERRTEKNHVDHLQAVADFRALHSKEMRIAKELRSSLNTINDPTINQTLSNTFLHSEEALFEHKNKKHINVWLADIDTLKRQLGTLNSGENKAEVQRSLESYHTLAETLGAHVLTIENLKSREMASLQTVDSVVQNFMMQWLAQYQNTIKTMTAQEQAKVNMLLITATLLGCAMALLASFILSRRILKPLVSLRDHVIDVGHGNLQEKMEVTSTDELGELATAFNQMTEDLEHSVTSISILNNEVTERRNAERRANESLETVNKILENLPFGLIVIGTDKKIRRMNKGAEAILNRSRNEAIGQICHTYICPNPPGNCPILDKGKSVDLSECIAIRSDGAHIPIIKTVIPIELDGEKVLLEAFVDISIQKRIEEDLIQTTKELEHTNEQLSEQRDKADAANRAKSAFLANMSHEIRTPMNGVLGMAELLQGTDLDTDQQRFATGIRNSAKALLGILNDILDFSKIESNHLDLVYKEFNLLKMVDDFIDMVALQVASKNLDLTLTVAPDVPAYVVGDSQRLKQVLGNLVNNAIKFTDEGNISVTITQHPDDTENISLKFTVEDSGIGIPPAKQDVLFKAFSQADSSHTRRYGGTGLGLAIARQLVKLMGGTIGCESTHEAGSMFWFTASFGYPVSESPRHPMFPDYTGTVSILMDNPNQVTMIDSILARWALDHKLFNEVEDLVGHLEQQTDAPQVIIVDDSVEPDLFDALSAQSTDPRPIHIIVLRNYSDSDLERKSSGIRYCTVHKPLKRKHLLTALSKALNIAPSWNDTADNHAPSPQDISKSWPGYRILLVEDNDVNRQVAFSMLKKHGFNVDVAHHGEEALESLRETMYDCVFMDCQMPVMDGFEATQRIRNDTDHLVKNPDVPIIALTAHAVKPAKKKCLEAGMNDYLAKPISQHDLETMLSKWLPENKPTPMNSPAPEMDDPGVDTSIFDYNALHQRVLGDIKSMKKIINLFLDDTPRLIQRLKDALNDEDYDRVFNEAHTLKGTAGNLGGNALQDTALKMQDASQNHDICALKSLFSEIQTNLQLLEVELKKFLAS